MLENLPEEFRTSYQYSEFLYNNICAIYNSCLDAKAFDVEIQFKDILEGEALNKLNGEEIYNWLLKNGYEEEHFNLIYRQAVKALIYDFIVYISESLSNTLKGNLVITFTLLRKPFKENLSVLETIYADPRKFYKIFTEGKSKDFDPYKIGKSERLQTIEKVVKLNEDLMFVDAELLYDLRFNKNKEYSFDGIFNKSTHLVTTDKSIETEKTNFNMIFSNDDDHYTQYGALFSSLPLILYYSYYVFSGVLNSISKSKYDDLFRSRRIFGMIGWSSDMHLHDASKKMVNNLFDSKENEDLVCEKCKKDILMDRDFMINYSIHWIIECKHCGSTVNLYDNNELPNHWLQP